MKPIFHHRPLNGPFEDPAVFVRILRERRALLFDAGDVSGLALRDLMKITDVFITHAHIDHFIGFDIIIRAVLRRDIPITFYGPEGILDRIQGKLRGYTWNLASEYPLIIYGIEIRDQTVLRASFRAENGFERKDLDCDHNRGIVLDSPLFSVHAAVLEHDIPSLGFFIKEKIHINIDKAALTKRGLETGPWLNSLKDYVRTGKINEEVDTGKGLFKVSDLQDLYMMTEGQKIAYIMDASPTETNIERIIRFVSHADVLYIEAYFRHRDLAQAVHRNHLTAKLAGSIAKQAGVKNLHVLHFSRRYSDRVEDLIQEADEGFRNEYHQ